MSWATEAASSEHGAELLYAVGSEVLVDALVSACRAGWLVSLSTSRDGGALSIATIADGERTRAWCADVKELETALGALTRAANA